jgi:aspartyl protease family protein
VIAWALRWALLCCGLALVGVGLLDRTAALSPNASAKGGRPVSPPPAAASPANRSVFTANPQGHVILNAAVNGVPIRMLVDTGASLMTLTPADARAAGINLRELVFNGHVQTANGPANIAPVMLREVRIGQLSVYDVPAAVLENLNVSLLGMSFLGRLQGYEMRDGKLTISW